LRLPTPLFQINAAKIKEAVKQLLKKDKKLKEAHKKIKKAVEKI
jgi:hypothetical protein